MKLIVNDHIYLSPFLPSDKPALVEHLREKVISDHTLRIPYPYTEDHADEWLALSARTTEQQGQPVHWAIREAGAALIGGCGFDGFQIGTSHRAEIGYWLARPYWGRGIMTAVVRQLCQFAFSDWGLVKITAHAFSFNAASARVLEKCGFEQEGYLRRHFDKDGQWIDVRLFGLLK
jgi:RimJ/RimL family protein N-acetyltransferase